MQTCYEECLSRYRTEDLRGCGDEWIAIKNCQLDIDCQDLFGDCGEIEAAWASCEDAGTGGTGGNGVGTVCASDDASVGDTATCPDSTEVIDFCINGGNGNCYYVVGGENVDCGNCFDGALITTCAQEAIALCP